MAAERLTEPETAPDGRKLTAVNDEACIQGASMRAADDLAKPMGVSESDEPSVRGDRRAGESRRG